MTTQKIIQTFTSPGYEEIILPYTKMDFILLHKCIEDKEYLEQHQYFKGYKILDNSAYQLQKSMDIDVLLKYAKLLNVDEIVAPDKMGDSKYTIEMTKKFIEVCPSKYAIMSVVHGKNRYEWNDCFNTLNSLDGIDVIGINKKDIIWDGINIIHTNLDLSDDMYINRINTLCYLSEKVKSNKPIHLLGMNDVRDILTNFKYYNPNVRSIDGNILLKLAKTTDNKIDKIKMKQLIKFFNSFSFKNI